MDLAIGQVLCRERAKLRVERSGWRLERFSRAEGEEKEAKSKFSLVKMSEQVCEIIGGQFGIAKDGLQ
jgi:hypothetical protein